MILESGNISCLILTKILVEPNPNDLRSRRGIKVVSSSTKTLGVVPGVLQNFSVVSSAQETTNNPILVVVVYIQVCLSGTPTDGTSTTLSLKKLAVLSRLQAVCLLDTCLM